MSYSLELHNYPMTIVDSWTNIHVLASDVVAKAKRSEAWRVITVRPTNVNEYGLIVYEIAILPMNIDDGTLRTSFVVSRATIDTTDGFERTVRRQVRRTLRQCELLASL